jgi:hypothetical protein
MNHILEVGAVNKRKASYSEEDRPQIPKFHQGLKAHL